MLVQVEHSRSPSHNKQSQLDENVRLSFLNLKARPELRIDAGQTAND
jgi:hypothetical protein